MIRLQQSTLEVNKPQQVNPPAQPPHVQNKSVCVASFLITVRIEIYTSIFKGYWEPHLARLHNQGKYNAWSTDQNYSWIQVWVFVCVYVCK